MTASTLLCLFLLQLIGNKMKAYQGLFAQALYLAAKPLDKEQKQKLNANSGQRQCSAQKTKSKVR